MAKRASITGVTGQERAYPAEFMVGKGYEATPRGATALRQV